MACCAAEHQRASRKRVGETASHATDSARSAELRTSFLLSATTMLSSLVHGDGCVAEGSEAILQAYSKVGLGWLMAVLRFPLIRWAIDGVYALVSRHRYTISRFLPGGGALASAVSGLKDVENAAMGIGCEDEEECMLDYGDEDDDETDAVAIA